VTFRTDVEGLRGIAVLAVVVFHFFPNALPGGFVGVDVFFVLSGYLISRIIIDHIRAGNFSFRQFYEARARRILPALFVVIAATLIAGGVFLTANAYKSLGESAVAAVLSASNVLFWLRSGYFDPGAAVQPLLHTWSLGVEEQFYIVFPVLLWALARWFPRRLTAILAALALVSFGISLYQSRFSPDAAFYLPFSRVWELLLGCLIGVSRGGLVPRGASSDALAGIGLALVAASILVLDEGATFPAPWALAPCAGTFLIILSGEAGAPGRVARLLSLPFLRFFGRISYSFYLWHWPVIVLVRLALQRELPVSLRLFLLFATLVLSYVTWRWVEQPARRRFVPGHGLVLPVGAAGLSAAFLAVGLAISLTKGLPQRFPPDLRNFALASRDTNPRRAACDGVSPARLRAGDVCRIGPNLAPTFALLGDSFGDAVAPGVEAAALKAGRTGVILTKAGCRPLVGMISNPGCRLFLAEAQDYLARTPEITTVIIAARWTRIAEGTRFGFIPTRDAFNRDALTTATGYDENRRVFVRSLERTVAALRPRRVFIAAFFPEQRVDVPQAALLNALASNAPLPGVERAAFDSRQNYVRTQLGADAARLGFQLIDVGAQLCDADQCRVVDGDRVLYADDNHLSATGARAVADAFLPALAGR
jgi:peptidoglycan/LPS O-acetylase OafA/YrhL